MLNEFRKYQQNFIFSVLILAIVGVMALYGINQLNSDKQAGAGTAAWVNGEAITNREFGQVLEATIESYRARLGGQLDERFIHQFQIPQHTLDEMVQFKLLAQQAHRLGFRVADQELADFIRKAPAFQRNGKFDPELYRQHSPNRGLEEKRIRESMLLRKIQLYLAGRIQTPSEMLDREYQLKETKVNLGFARIDFKALAGKPSPSQKDVDDFLRATPEDALKAYYDSHQRDFTISGAVNLRQIRVGLPFQASADKKAEAKKKIEGLAKDVTPENFEAMAKKHSDDEHAGNGGNAGWVNRGTLERAMEDAINTLQPNAVSSPVETPFGYYLLQVRESRPQSVRPLDTARKDIVRELWREQQIETFTTKKKAQWEARLAAGQTIEPQLRAAKIEIKKTGPFSLGQGFIPQIGQADQVVDAIFHLTKQKPFGSQLYANGNDFFFIKLESVEGPKASDAEKNRDSVAASLTTTLQTTLITKWIDDLKEKAAIRIEATFEDYSISR